MIPVYKPPRPDPFRTIYTCPNCKLLERTCVGNRGASQVEMDIYYCPSHTGSPGFGPYPAILEVPWDGYASTWELNFIENAIRLPAGPDRGVYLSWRLDRTFSRLMLIAVHHRLVRPPADHPVGTTSPSVSRP